MFSQKYIVKKIIFFLTLGHYRVIFTRANIFDFQYVLFVCVMDPCVASALSLTSLKAWVFP